VNAPIIGRQIDDLSLAQTVAGLFGFTDPQSTIRVTLDGQTSGVAIGGRSWHLLILFEPLAGGAVDDLTVRPYLALFDPSLIAQHADWNRRWKAQPVIDAVQNGLLHHLPVSGGVQ
jgi:hypothetical protein